MKSKHKKLSTHIYTKIYETSKLLSSNCLK